MNRALSIALIAFLPAQAFAAEQAKVIEFCDFLNKVTEAAGEQFWPLTAAQRDPNASGNPLKANITLAPNIRCFVIPRHMFDGKIDPAEFSCDLLEFVQSSSSAALTNPEKVFDGAATRLRECLPRARFDRHTEGRRGRSGYEVALSWPQPGYTMALKLSIQPVFEKEPDLIAVQLSVTDTAQH